MTTKERCHTITLFRAKGRACASLQAGIPQRMRRAILNLIPHINGTILKNRFSKRILETVQEMPVTGESLLHPKSHLRVQRKVLGVWSARFVVAVLMLGVIGLAGFAKCGQFAPRSSETRIFSRSTKMDEVRQNDSRAIQITAQTLRSDNHCASHAAHFFAFEPAFQNFPASSLESATASFRLPPLILLI